MRVLTLYLLHTIKEFFISKSGVLNHTWDNRTSDKEASLSIGKIITNVNANTAMPRHTINERNLGIMYFVIRILRREPWGMSKRKKIVASWNNEIIRFETNKIRILKQDPTQRTIFGTTITFNYNWTKISIFHIDIIYYPPQRARPSLVELFFKMINLLYRL